MILLAFKTLDAKLKLFHSDFLIKLFIYMSENNLQKFSLVSVSKQPRTINIPRRFVYEYRFQKRVLEKQQG